MKIEKLKITQKPHNSDASELLRLLKPGQVLRAKTAAEFRRLLGISHSVARSCGVKFGTQIDGADVLFFIKEKP